VKLKTVIKWGSTLLAVATLATGTVAFFRGHVPVLGRALNQFEHAQRKTVLVVAPDGQGSGVVVKRGGKVFVWTACHVVYGHEKVLIKTIVRNGFHKVGESVFTGRVVAYDAGVDVALLYVDAPSEYFEGAEFDSLIPPSVGSAVYHVGNFLGAAFDGSVSTGVISQIGVNPGEGWPWAITDQTTASIVPGSSGGPLFRTSSNKILGLVVGHVPPRPIYVYVPVRVIEVWAEKAGVLWAVRGNKSPKVLSFATFPKPEPVLILLIGPTPPTPPQQKKK
jgi:S1-C subfamily serine protease